ncbi:MAG TPA: HAD hydrolase-like protein, partial [Thermoanaerobaculia bacterium]|nr:HAD hydrolase-like protein [Thermoanaerobaculia bacterium]
MTIRALIFDFDGLIIDSESPELLAWQEVFVEHGCELSLEVWADCVGRPPGFFDPCEHLVQLSGRVVDTESVRARVRSRARKIVFEQTPLPGVVEWLASAWSLELRVGIASSS